jgi:Ni/Co efflux regulator RcnB
MKARTIVSSLAIASLGFSSLAFAQPAPREARQDARVARQDIRDAQRDLRRADTAREARDARQDMREAQHDLREAREDQRDARRYADARGPQLHRGDRLPVALRQHQDVVANWRGHHLAAPPAGYQWFQVGTDYVLAAIATGVIANLILGS